MVLGDKANSGDWTGDLRIRRVNAFTAEGGRDFFDVLLRGKHLQNGDSRVRLGVLEKDKVEVGIVA